MTFPERTIKIKGMLGGLIQKFLYGIKDRVALSPWLSRLAAQLHGRFSTEKGLMGKGWHLLSSPRVAFNFHSPHLAEHMGGLFQALLHHGSMVPLAVVPTGIFPFSRPVPLQEYESRFGVRYGETLLPNSFLDMVEPRVFIESSITSLRGMAGPAIKILSHHGLACMGFGKDPRKVRYLKDYHYIFLTGPPQKRALLHASRRYGGKLPRLLEVGYIMGDRLLALKDRFDRQGFLESLGLDPGITVLYAPTWGPFSSVGSWLGEVVKVCEELGFNLLLRFHPLTFRGRTRFERGPGAWKGWLEDLTRRHPWVKKVSEFDIISLLLTAHVLITDVSSVGMDFLLLKKPVLFLPSPGFSEVWEGISPIETFRKGREVTDRKQLKRALLKCVEGKGPPYPCRERLVYNPGRATEKAVAFLEEVVEGGA